VFDLNKNENEKNAINARDSKQAINPAMPVRVFISSTNSCNLNCIMCPNSEKRGSELPFEIFKDLAKELFPLAKEYHTTTSGEPLLTSYFKEIPFILRNYDTKLNLTTNGMMLTEDISRLIMPVLSDVKVSFDGSTKKTFEKIRLGSNYENIIKNIEDFIKIRDSSYYKPTLTLQTTLMLENIKELPDIVKIAHNIGADRVKAYLMIAYNPTMKEQSLWFHKKLANECIEVAEELSKSYRLKTKFPKRFSLDKDNKMNTFNYRNLVCHFLWQEGWIETNGNVISCCNIDRSVMGNIYQESFTKIWNNEKYQDMRRRLNSADPYTSCKYCALVNEFRPNGLDYNYRSLIRCD